MLPPLGPLSRRRFLAGVAAGAWAGGYAPAAGRNDALKKQTAEAVGKGLGWLKEHQARDGSWATQAGQYTTAMTALAGMALLMEGSNIKEGRYSDQVKRAVDWFLAPGRQQASGLFANPRNPTEHTRYMYGQGFGTLFLACAHGSEEDKDEQEKVARALKEAVEFICQAQTSKTHRRPEGKEVEIGGWGYVTAKDGNNFDEGSVTITQLQALRAARNATIPVPKEAIDKAVAYLEACTTPRGGVIYSYARGAGAAAGRERIPITAAAVACAISSGELTAAIKVMNAPNPPTGAARPSCVRWIEFCKNNIPIGRARGGHDDYLNYYFSQVVHALGDDRYGQLFPAADEAAWLTWTGYKDAMFPRLIETQNKADGSWPHASYGPVYTTAINLSILQLEQNCLPFYQR